MLDPAMMDVIKEDDAAQNEAFEKMAKQYKPNASFPEQLTAKNYRKYKLFEALAMTIILGLRYGNTTMSLIGPNGMGKTFATRQFIENFVLRGTKFYEIPWNTSMDDLDTQALQMMGPAAWDEMRKVLRLIMNELYKARDGQKGLMLLDDFNRAMEHLLNILMQLFDQHELLGQRIENLAGMILLSNASGGDDDVVALDFTQADRSYTVVLDRDDSPWEYGLAAKHPKIDLKDAFRIVKSLPGPARDVMSARTLDHMIQVLMYGLPGVLAIPVSGPDGFMVRQRLRDGDDITDTVIADIARSIGAPNPAIEHVYDLYGKVIDFAVDTGLNVMIYGEPGVGKTEATKARVRARGFRTPEECGPGEYPTVFATSAPGLSREYFSAPSLSEDRSEIRHIGAERFMIPEPYIWLNDEATRVPPEVKGVVKTVQYDRRIGNTPLNLRSCISLANPPMTVDGMALSLGEPFDLAEATRYAASLYVGPDDIDWKRHLRGKYGEEFASYFIEWWEEDLDATTRPKVTPRCLERMVRLTLVGKDPQMALPAIDGEQVLAPLALLKVRLEKGEIPRLRRIVAEADRYAEELSRGHWTKDEKGRNIFVPEDPSVHERVAEAFRQADLDQLEANREVLVRLFPLLSLDFHERFIQASNLQQFWVKVLLEGSKDRKVG